MNRTLVVLLVALVSGCASARTPREPRPMNVFLTVNAVPGAKPKQYFVEARYVEGTATLATVDRDPSSRIVQAPALYVLAGEEATIFVGEKGPATLVSDPDDGSFREVEPLQGGFVLRLRVDERPDAKARLAVRTWVLADARIVHSAKGDYVLADRETAKVPLRQR